MVSSNEAGFNLRETDPLSRNILHTAVLETTETGQRTNPRKSRFKRVTEVGQNFVPTRKVSTGYLTYPADVRNSEGRGAAEEAWSLLYGEHYGRI